MKPENNTEAAETVQIGVSQAVVQERLVRHLLDALKRIAECEDSPDIDIGGGYQFGLHCGVEDRGLRDRYEGADYGYARGVEATLEWASNEAKHALESMPNADAIAPDPAPVKPDKI